LNAGNELLNVQLVQFVFLNYYANENEMKKDDPVFKYDADVSTNDHELFSEIYST